MRYLWTCLMALAILAFVNVAQASEPLRLADDQLDQVTAGAIVWPQFLIEGSTIDRRDLWNAGVGGAFFDAFGTFPTFPDFPTFVWWEFPDFDWSAFD